MDRVARRGLVTAMVAGGVLASAGCARADSGAGATAAGSPGVQSGNTVQAPVDVPVNVCGDTVDVAGLLDPASGTSCTNPSPDDPAAAATGGSGPVSAPAATAAQRSDGVRAASHSAGSPRALSGNTLELPVPIPVDASGASVNVVGVGDPASGTTSVNGPATPPPPAHLPIPAPPNEPAPTASVPSPAEPATAAPELAHTGASGLGLAGAASAALLVGGSVLYRRAKAAGRR